MARLITAAYDHPLSLEDFLEKKKGLLTPKNCQVLQVPKTQDAIWNKISNEARGRDKTLRKLQADFVSFMIAITEPLQDLMALAVVAPDVIEPVKQLGESLKLVALFSEKASQKIDVRT